MNLLDEIENNKKFLKEKFEYIKKEHEEFANIYIDNCSYSKGVYFFAIKMTEEQYLGNARITFQNNIDLPEYRKDVQWVNEAMLLTFEKKERDDFFLINVTTETEDDD